ncbi:uncharacterized protein LOC142665837 [Rhinoderma darwinii]|uniref:uncharacterized protein LOC142665837 n=1 Tax=Rhinoderma darwinii TaxID=43563 RepID=UPI003F67F95F
MKYTISNPKKDIDIRVLFLHLRPSAKNKSTRSGLDKVQKSPHNGQTIHVGGRRKDVVVKQDNPKYKVSQSKGQQELEYVKLVKKYLKRKSRSKNRNQPRKRAKVRESQRMLEREDGKGYKGVKRKNLRSRRIELFTRSWREKQPKGERQSTSWKVKPGNGEFQKSELLPENWGDVGHLALPPMIDGEVLNEENPLTHNQPRGAKYYNTRVEVLQKRDGKEKQKLITMDGPREDFSLDHPRNRKLKFLESEGKVASKEPILTEDHPKETESSLVTFANEHINYFPNRGSEQTSVTVLPTRDGLRDSELSPDNLQLWGMVVPIEDIPIIDIFSHTIRPVETHSGPYKADNQAHLWSHSDILSQAEGSGSYDSEQSLDHEGTIVTLTPNNGSAQEKLEFRLSGPLATIQQSSYNTSPSPTNNKYTEAPRVTGSNLSEGLHDGIFRPLEATMNQNPGPIYCKPGYKEYGGVCKSQCDIDGIYCGKNGHCVIVENIGAMCRCQQRTSLCYGGECCRSSLTTLQLAYVISSCCILLSAFLGSLPFLIRRMKMKTISKSGRTRLWISTLMPQSSTSSSSQSADFTACSDFESSSDISTFHYTKQEARNSTMWQCERTRL